LDPTERSVVPDGHCAGTCSTSRAVPGPHAIYQGSSFPAVALSVGTGGRAPLGCVRTREQGEAEVARSAALPQSKGQAYEKRMEGGGGMEAGVRERPAGSPAHGFKLRAECVLKPPEEAGRRPWLSPRCAWHTPAFPYSRHSEMLKVGFLS